MIGKGPALILTALMLGLMAVAISLKLVWDDPLIIPRQAVFPETDAFPAIVSDQAYEPWQEAMDKFRRAASVDDAHRETFPLLQRIWSAWPNSDGAVMARSFAIYQLPTRKINDKSGQLAIDYLEQGLMNPGLYFSRRYEASSQAIAQRALSTLVDSGRSAEARKLCFQLRWAMPRVDLIARTCSAIMNDRDLDKFDIKRAIAALPPYLKVYNIPKTNTGGDFKEGSA